jgi:hypothetical protein
MDIRGTLSRVALLVGGGALAGVLVAANAQDRMAREAALEQQEALPPDDPNPAPETAKPVAVLGPGGTAPVGNIAPPFFWLRAPPPYVTLTPNPEPAVEAPKPEPPKAEAPKPRKTRPEFHFPDSIIRRESR